MAVRRESVVLSLDDRFSSGMAIAAARTEMLRRELDKLDGSGVRGSRGVDKVTRSTEVMGASAAKQRNTIDQFSGRLQLLGRVGATLGPALIPVGAVAIPAMAGLAAQFGFAGIAAGTAVAAFQGVGDALTAMNKYHLEPTAENLENARQAMKQISPDARQFVRELREMQPALKGIRDTAAENMFPGLAEGLDSVSLILPKVERIVGAVAGQLGDIGASTGKSLASGRWTEFFDFLETEAPEALRDMADIAGNTGHAMAEMWMAFDPLNDSFSTWMVNATQSLDEWASGLEQTQGFQEFIDYVRTTGPQVAETFAAIGNAVVQIVQAAAPLAGPVLNAIEGFANAVASIADSDLGTPIMAAVAALSAYRLAMTAAGRAQNYAWGREAKKNVTGFRDSIMTVTSAQDRARMSGAQLVAMEQKKQAAWRGTLATAGKGAALMGGLAVASTGAADSVGLTNTASLALMGTMIGPWGAAMGGAIGLTMDLTQNTKGLADATEAAKTSMSGGTIESMTAAYKRLNAEIEKSKERSLLDMLPDTGAIGGVVAGFKTKAQQGAQDTAAQLKGSINFKQNVKDMAAMASAGARFAQAQAAGFKLTAAGAREAAGGIKAFTAAMAAANAVMGRQQSWDDYRMALLDMKDQIRDTGKTLNRNGDIIRGQGRDMQRLGLQSRTSLRGMAKGAQDTAGQMKNFANRIKFLDGARRDFIKMATAMGASRPAARRMADSFGLVDRGAQTARQRIAEMRKEISQLKSKTVKADEKGAAAAKARVAALRAEIARLQGKTVTNRIITVRENRGASGNVGKGQAADAAADGARVPKTGLPYADRHLYLLADGERVISNRYGQADRHDALLTAINNDRRLANGGRTGPNSISIDGSRRRNDDEHEGVRRNLKKLKEALRESTAALNKEKAQRDQLRAKRSELAGSVRDKFLTDPFAGGNVWAAGGGNPIGVIQGDTAKAKAFKTVLYNLRKAGLKGDAYAAVAQTGDIGQAQALLGMGAAGIKQYQTAWSQRASAASAAGTYAGGAAYGSAQVETNREIRVLTAEVRRLQRQLRGQHKDGKKNRRENARETGREVGRAVNGGASKGARRSRGRR